jgi:hypothetical protein
MGGSSRKKSDVSIGYEREQRIFLGIQRGLKHISVVTHISGDGGHMIPLLLSSEVTDAVVRMLKSEGFRIGIDVILKKQDKPYMNAIFAEKKYERANQVVADLLGVCLVIFILVPAILLPAARPMMWWVAPDECSERDIQDGFTYLAIMFGGSLVTCVSYLLCLEAEGRTVWYSCIQLISAALNRGTFNPILILVLSMGIAGWAISLIASQLVTTIVLVVYFYTGTFTVRPGMAELFARPVNESCAQGRVPGLVDVLQHPDSLL